MFRRIARPLVEAEDDAGGLPVRSGIMSRMIVRERELDPAALPTGRVPRAAGAIQFGYARTVDCWWALQDAATGDTRLVELPWGQSLHSVALSPSGNELAMLTSRFHGPGVPPDSHVEILETASGRRHLDRHP